MSDNTYIGGVRRERVTFYDPAGAAVDPTEVTFTITPPEETTATVWTLTGGEVINDPALGAFYVDWPCAVAGAHVAEWKGTGGGVSQAVTAAQWVVRPLPFPWAPTVADLASMMRARTTIDDGAPSGAFSDDTSPTADQVQEYILRAVDDLAGRVGTSIPVAQHGLARNTALFNAAHLIELGYWPEQIQSERSPAVEYDRRWRDAMTALQQKLGAGESRGLAMLDITPDRGQTA